MKFLMCNPEYFTVSYEINPWMNVRNQVNNFLAIQQWENLVSKIESLGAEVYTMSGHPELPDIVFTANAGTIIDNQVLVSKFKYKERQPESVIYKTWFEKNGYSVLETDLDFEGAGDALFCNNTCYFGYGFRSNKDSYFQNSEFFGKSVKFLRLINPYFYHLDTCFCPLSKNDALIFPGAFSEEDFQLLEPDLNLLTVPEDEAVKFACNSICIDKTVIIASGCDKTAEILTNAGYKVVTVKLDQFSLSGGNGKCLTLRLD